MTVKHKRHSNKYIYINTNIHIQKIQKIILKVSGADLVK